ncbi:MAG TPA: hypothetical protein VFI34_11280 [Candidatus Limnocylindrales bacterium]|nr:hypothetical protein [Candidatus Limnocylindrales bacterium]
MGHLVGLIAVGFSRAWIRVDKIVAVAIVAILWALPFVILLLVRFEGDSALALIVFPASAGLIASIWLVVAWLVRRT